MDKIVILGAGPTGLGYGSIWSFGVWLETECELGVGFIVPGPRYTLASCHRMLAQ